MPTSLPKDDRNKLASAILKARVAAEDAVKKALQSLAVHEADPRAHMSPELRQFRTFLRAKARQLGDQNNPHQGTHEIKHLVESIAYERWNQMLFARFLSENDLLHTEDGIPATLGDCEELASDEGERDGFSLAVRYASRMLPQIFRPDDPTRRLEFDPYDQQQLKGILDSIPTSTFHADDSLGWVYQFWQAEQKKAVNDSGEKIGADELAPVTQLFTEDYMVSFLLDNSLGAWWASKRLTDEDLRNATSEDELRTKASLPGVPLEYLRFVKEEDSWTPAAGTYEKWPDHLSELTTLDPCCGSGHFLVFALHMLAPMRMEMEGLSAKDACDRVLSENLHGLELDQRCVALAAFNLALTAWKFPDAGGYRPLPELQLACSGLSVGAAKEEWQELALDKQNLRIALNWMHDVFKDAPVLGSLINPATSDAAKVADWGELSSALNEALQKEQNEERVEAGVVAQGLAKAATLLAGRYQWVITNVPYLGRGNQDEVMQDFCETRYPEGKSDLATVFLERCLEFNREGGTTSVVLPQNWLFLTSYKKFREKLLRNQTWDFIARLGTRAFETISGEVVNVILFNIIRGNTSSSDLLCQGDYSNIFRGTDVSQFRTFTEKAKELKKSEINSVEQEKQFKNPDTRIRIEDFKEGKLLSEYASGLHGQGSFDNSCFVFSLWEIPKVERGWMLQQTTGRHESEWSGLNNIFRWEDGKGLLARIMAAKAEEGYTSGKWKAGVNAWGKKGICVSGMGRLVVDVYGQNSFDENVAVILPDNPDHILPLWCFISDEEFQIAVREIDQNLKVSCNTYVKVPFDLEHWQKVAAEKYPNGLPKPYSDDPTQWIFHGHPSKCEAALQVAVSRLLGYRWPAELDASMELSDEARALVARCSELDDHTDDDGIACLPAVRGELPAAERVRKLLAAAFGEEWNEHKLDTLLEQAGSPGKKLDDWLRDHFFEQHCKLFHHRPFIWQIWDGRKDGFSALVNYHKLDNALLQKLIYSYLDEWIRVQKRDADLDVAGADLRLGAAQHLREQLEKILKGEAPYDIFVRWKSLEKQPIGWNPDLNDGVRLNIRPFMTPELTGGKKGAGVLRWKPNIHWKKDRGKDVASAPWYKLGLEYEGKEGDRINDHHLTLEEKKEASTV
jgi:hypothetical protein